MKLSLFVVFAVIGVSQGFFGSIGQTINNIGNTIQTGTDQAGKAAENLLTDAKNQVENVVIDITGQIDNAFSQVSDFSNGIQSAAKSIWDNVLSPIFDMLIKGGQLTLDENDGSIANIISRPTGEIENVVSQKYAQLVARLKSNSHHLYEQLFIMEQQALTEIQKGEANFEEVLTAFVEKIQAAQTQMAEWASEIKIELENYALNIEGDFGSILYEYNQNIDSSVQSFMAIFQIITGRLLQHFVSALTEMTLNGNAGN